MNINIRAMTLQDLNDVYEIERLANIFPWSLQSLRDSLNIGYDCWVLEMDKIVVAFAIMSIYANESHLLNIGVHPDKQGLGYGKVLLHHILEFAKQKQTTICYLEVRSSNTAAIQLYKNFGFKEFHRRKAYYPAKKGREDAIMMRLEF